MKNKIAELRKLKKITQEKLSKYIGVARSTLAMYEINASEPDFSTLIKISDYFNVSVDYLLGRTDFPAFRGKITETKSNSEYNLSDIKSEKVIRYSILENIRTDYSGITFKENSDDYQLVPLSILKGHNKRDFFVLKVTGNSMFPKFSDGDRVLVERCDRIENGKIAVMLFNGNNITMRIVCYDEEKKQLALVPINPEFGINKFENFELQFCKVLGRVVYLFRKIE